MKGEVHKPLVNNRHVLDHREMQSSLDNSANVRPPLSPPHTITLSPSPPSHPQPVPLPPHTLTLSPLTPSHLHPVSFSPLTPSPCPPLPPHTLTLSSSPQMCKNPLKGGSFFAKLGRPFCKNCVYRQLMNVHNHLNHLP